MLESFRCLLHKTDLVRGLKVDPNSFAAALTGSDGRPLPFDRLSAGERQLLATAMLWGLARASGRPIPTIIDTLAPRPDASRTAYRHCGVMRCRRPNTRTWNIERRANLVCAHTATRNECSPASIPSLPCPWPR